MYFSFFLVKLPLELLDFVVISLEKVNIYAFSYTWNKNIQKEKLSGNFCPKIMPSEHFSTVVQLSGW